MAKTDKQKLLTILKQTRDNASNEPRGILIGINALESVGLLNFDDEKTRKALINLCTAIVREDTEANNQALDKLDNLIASKRYWATKKVTVDDLINYFIKKIKKEAKKKDKTSKMSIELEKLSLLIDTFNELVEKEKKGKLQKTIEEMKRQNNLAKEIKKKK